MADKKIGIIFISIISVKLCLTIFLSDLNSLKYIVREADSVFQQFSIVPLSHAQQKTEAPPTEKKNEAQSEIDFELLKSFEKKREELAKKENEIKMKEEQLSLIQQNIQQKLSELESIKGEMEKLIILRKDLEEKSINQLVKVYSAMPPAEAASQFERLDRDITIQILSRMKGKSAAKILSNINPAIAVQISEQLVKRKPQKQPAEEQKK
jgi:flagellar motility protein MotE (MotC chaperone)